MLQRNSTFDLTGKPGGFPTRHAMKRAIIRRLGWRRLWRSERRAPRARADAVADFGWLAAYGGTKLTYPPTSGYNLSRALVEHFPETTSIAEAMACMQRHGLRNLGDACEVGRRCVQLPEEVVRSDALSHKRRDCCGLDRTAPTPWLSPAEAAEADAARAAMHARVAAGAAEIEALRKGPGGMAAVQARTTQILEELYDVAPGGAPKREAFSAEEGRKVAAEVDRLMSLQSDGKGGFLPAR